MGSSLMLSIVMSGILLFLVALAFNIWSLNESWQTRLRNTEETAINLSLSQARQAQDTFLQTEITLREIQRIIYSESSSGINNAALSKTMRDLQSRLPQLHGLFYYDAQGNWLATSAIKTPSGINNADREYFSYHRLHPHNDVHLGPVIRSRSTGDLVIPVSLRVSNARGEFSGVLLATVRVNYFRHVYHYFEMGDKDVLVLMLTDSTVLYARPMPDSYIGKNLAASQLFKDKLIKAEQGSGEWNAALDGKKRIFGYAKSERYPLVVAAGYDKDTLIKQWVKRLVKDLLLNCALLMSFLLLGMVVFRQVKNNIRVQSELTLLGDKLTATNVALEHMAMVDALTGLANRRHFDLYLNDCLIKAKEQGRGLSLILLDIDFFKRYNDTYGHVEGDRCLCRVAGVVKHASQHPAALAARYGGEEFAVILPDAQAEAAMAVAVRIIEGIRDLTLPHVTTDMTDKIVTLSAGCGTFRRVEEPETATPLKLLADSALYEAKMLGRNRAAGYVE